MTRSRGMVSSTYQDYLLAAFFVRHLFVIVCNFLANPLIPIYIAQKMTSSLFWVVFVRAVDLKLNQLIRAEVRCATLDFSGPKYDIGMYGPNKNTLRFTYWLFQFYFSVLFMPT